MSRHAVESASRTSEVRARVTDLRLRIPTTLGRRPAWVHAAENVSLAVRAGEFHALVGESGSGKSILASSMLGMLPPGTRKSGSIELTGQDVSAASEARWRSLRGRAVALAGQSAATGLTPTRTVGRQLVETIREVSPDLRLRARGRRGEKSRLDHAAELLATVELEPRLLAAYPHELSGGMAQRAVLAFALAGEPQVLIADEPTAGLDPELTDHVLGLLRGIANTGTAVLTITHDLASLTRTGVADTVSVMYAGRLVETGPAGRVLSRPEHAYTRGLLRALPQNGLHRTGTPPPSLTHPADADIQPVEMPAHASGVVVPTAGGTTVEAADGSRSETGQAVPATVQAAAQEQGHAVGYRA